MRKLRLEMLNNLRLRSSGYSNHEQEPEYSSWIEASILNFVQFAFVYFFFSCSQFFNLTKQMQLFSVILLPKV